MKTVLWVDDNLSEREAGQRMLSRMTGVRFVAAASSSEAERILDGESVDCVVTDILRRNPDETISTDDGYVFFREVLRPKWPELPVVFHTKNLPTTFVTDRHSQYLSKWEPEDKKAIDLEPRLTAAVNLYDAFAHERIWARLEPRLVRVRADLLSRLRSPAEIWQLSPTEFERLIAELLDKIGFDVLWVPGGNDQGVDIIAGSRDESYLIDVKRYSPSNPVQVELVRHVYGVAAAVQDERPDKDWHGGIITSSRFTSGAEEFQRSTRVRPLLRDGAWLEKTLAKYLPS